MIPAALFALAFAAEIAVHVEEAGELEQSETLHIAEQLARACEARTSSTARVEDPAWWGCPEDSEDRCVRDVRARSDGAADVVVLRLFGGARSVRVIAARYSERREPRTATIDLSRTSTVWNQTLAALAVALFPEARGRREGEQLAGAPLVLREQSGGAGPLPYVLFGVGAASAACSTGLWISSQNARSELEGGLRSHAEYESLDGRMRTHGLISGGLLITAAVAVVAGAILLWTREPSVDLSPERLDARSGAGAF